MISEEPRFAQKLWVLSVALGDISTSDKLKKIRRIITTAKDEILDVLKT